MKDIWSFLLQTLTASGVAALLLALKAVFRDKLSPRWQFAAWGVLAMVLLLPAGWRGRYVLFNWPFYVELLRSALTGEYGALAHVTVPLPIPAPVMPRTAADWLFAVYALGTAVFLLWYVYSYVRLRLALRRGRPVEDGRVRAVAEVWNLPVCPAVEVDGLPSAFICGVFQPVLALPAGAETDEKVLLHELLHLKYRDAAWGLVICLFRCLHWCNPLLWYCADQAGNDLESLCDQRALERLEGEERRDYGRILLSMADEKYARAPGTSSAANGGKNIRRRIEAIARFKRYPAGMALVSVCVALVLAAPLVIGARAETAGEWGLRNKTVAMACARTTYCTTYAGAFDTYAKAVFTQRVDYRAMCAPLDEQNELAEHWGAPQGRWSWPDVSWKDVADLTSGYEIYNVTPVGEDAVEGVLVMELQSPPSGEQWSGLTHERWLAVQKLRAQQEGERWVVVPQEELQAVQGDQRAGGNLGVPAWVYEGQYGDFTIRLQWQTTASVNSYQSSGGFWSFPVFDTTPKIHGEFDRAERSYLVYAVYNGDPADRERYREIRVEYTPIYSGAGGEDKVKITSEQTRQDERDLEEYWNEYTGDWIFLDGGGGGYEGPEADTYQFPSAYGAKLYLNGEFASELTLLPAEGGEWIAF